jgi:hypothetical protein
MDIHMLAPKPGEGYPGDWNGFLTWRASTKGFKPVALAGWGDAARLRRGCNSARGATTSSGAARQPNTACASVVSALWKGWPDLPAFAWHGVRARVPHRAYAASASPT